MYYTSVFYLLDRFLVIDPNSVAIKQKNDKKKNKK